MIKLEILKRSCYLDYKNVEKYINQNKMKERGEEPCGAPVRTVSLTNKSFKIDEAYSPMSSSAIID